MSRDLNDQVPGNEYLRWSYEQLLSYYREVILELAGTAKWLFTHTVVVPLAEGNVWQSACGCTHILRVFGESSVDGELLSNAQEKSNDNIYLWPGTTSATRCDRIDNYSAPFTSYTIDRIQDQFFKVYPPVLPADGQRYALVQCYTKPDAEDESFSVPYELVRAIKQWMLYRALIVDSENNAEIRDVAKTHLQTYQSCLALLQAQNKEIEDKHNANSPVRAVQDGASKQVQAGA